MDPYPAHLDRTHTPSLRSGTANLADPRRCLQPSTHHLAPSAWRTRSATSRVWLRAGSAWVVSSVLAKPTASPVSGSPNPIEPPAPGCPKADRRGPIAEAGEPPRK